MRRDDESYRTMETYQAKRAEAVIETDGGRRCIGLGGRQRMEVRGAGCLRKQKDDRHQRSRPAHPSLVACYPVCFVA